jgi:hypothetical protein
LAIHENKADVVAFAAQRWRFLLRAVSGHGPAMHSTRFHANAAAAAHGESRNKCNSNNTREINDD